MITHSTIFKIGLLLIIAGLIGCIPIKLKGYETMDQVGKDLTDGILQSVDENQEMLDSLALRLSQQIVNSAIEGVENLDLLAFKDDINGILSGALEKGLLSPGNREALLQMTDQLMFKVDSNLMVTIRKLPGELLSQDLLNRVDQIRSSLLGEETKAQLGELVALLVQNANEELREGLMKDLHRLLDSAERKGLGFVSSTKEEASDYTRELIGGIIVIVIVSGIVIYLVRRKRDQYKSGLLESVRRIDTLDRESYERIKFKPEDFKSSDGTYKAINSLIQQNEEVFEKKKQFKEKVGLAFEHIVQSIVQNYSETEIQNLLNEAEMHGPELYEFLKEEIAKQQDEAPT